MNLDIPIATLLADAKASEQAAINALPMLVSSGTISQDEADGVRGTMREGDSANR